MNSHITNPLYKTLPLNFTRMNLQCEKCVPYTSVSIVESTNSHDLNSQSRYSPPDNSILWNRQWWKLQLMNRLLRNLAPSIYASRNNVFSNKLSVILSLSYIVTYWIFPSLIRFSWNINSLSILLSITHYLTDAATRHGVYVLSRRFAISFIDNDNLGLNIAILSTSTIVITTLSMYFIKNIIKLMFMIVIPLIIALLYAISSRKWCSYVIIFYTMYYMMNFVLNIFQFLPKILHIH